MKKTVILLLTCSLVFVLFGCGADNSNNKSQRTVRICHSEAYVSATSTIMEKEGILDKHLPQNISVEWKVIASGPDIRDALVSDNIDIADFSMMTFLTSRENELPISLISYSGSTPIYLYSHDDSIKTIEDFNASDSIAITNKNTNLHIAFLALCQKQFGNALELDDNLVAIPAADALASLETSDDFQGAIFSFPMCSQADKMENLEMISNMDDLIKTYGIGSVNVARSSFYSENKDIIDAFRQAQKEAIQFIIDNPDKAAEDLYEIYGCTKDDIVKAIENMPPTDVVSGYNEQAELLYEAGILTKEPQLLEDLENYDEIPH